MIMQPNGKTRTIINAFGAPHIAVKYEAEIGKLMAKQAKKEGHRSALPRIISDDHAQLLFSKETAERNASRILAAMTCETFQSVSDIARNIDMGRETAVSVMRRLRSEGKVVAEPLGNRIVFALARQN